MIPDWTVWEWLVAWLAFGRVTDWIYWLISKWSSR